MSSLASCPPGFAWARNSENLDPCAVGSSLISLCDPSGEFEGIPALSKGDVYPHPTHDLQNKCVCSSVVYAMVSVCSACQNADYSSWPSWSSSCSQGVYAPTFPLNTNISIPQWAIYDVQTEPKFDIVRAQNSVTSTPTTTNATETPTTPVTPVVQVNTTSAAFTSTSETASASTITSQTSTSTITVAESPISPSEGPTLSEPASSTALIQGTQASGADPAAVTVPEQTQPNQSTSSATKKSNTGAVAGGTVAGIIALIIIGGLLFWWIRRQRRSRMAPSAAYMAAYGTARPPTNMSQRPYQGATQMSSFISNSNVPYHDDEFRASAYSDIRQS